MKTRAILLSTTVAGFAMASAQADVPAVITDTPVVHSLTAQVMGDLGEPALLLDRGADPHNFQLRPTQARSLAEADMIFWVGPEMTPWLQRAIDGVEARGEIVTLLTADGVRLQEYAHGHTHDHDHGHDHDDHGHDHDDHGHDHDDHGHDHDDHGHDHDDHGHDHDDHGHDHDDHGHDHDDHGHDHDDHGHDHHHDGTDPHAWLDPHNAAAWVRAIAAHLSERDPDNADIYAANAAAAIADIEALEAEIAEMTEGLGAFPVVAFHDAYGYFSDRFGINVVGTITLGDAAAPGAARLAELRDQLADGEVVCIFPEVNHSSRYVDMLVEGTDVRVGALLDPAGVALDFGPDLYATLMRNLARDIAACVTES